MKLPAFKLAASGLIVSLSISCEKDELAQDAEILPDENEKTSMTAAQHSEMLNSRSNFLFGANGHPLGPKSYTSVPIEEQMEILKSMGMNCYRVDVRTMSLTGRVTVPYLFEPMMRAAQEHDIMILPMLYPQGMDLSADQRTNYERGYSRGSNFAGLYKDYFTYYELGNELCNKCILPNKPGKSVKSYDQEKFDAIAAYLRGMSNGVSAKDPDAQIIINACWLHYGFLRKLEGNGVNFDIIGYHWYDYMEPTARKSPYYISDITERVSSRFNKPIWFTEIGVRHRDTRGFAEHQKNFLTDFTAKCSNNPQVEAAMIYELFDEPQKTHPEESKYGIIDWVDPYSNWQFKDAASNFLID